MGGALEGPLAGCRVWAEITVIMRFFIGVGTWLSLVEHMLREHGVGGSNPLVPTIINLIYRTETDRQPAAEPPLTGPVGNLLC